MTDHDHPGHHRGHHDHGPGVSRGQDVDHFDARARDWDDDSKRRRAEVVATAIRERVGIDGGTRLLELGAGTGLATQALATGDGPGAVTLVEPSAGMRAVLADKVVDGTLPPSTLVLDVDLSTDSAPDLEVDLVVTVMTLHHITELDRVLSSLRDMLAIGGHLCIVDLVAEDGSFHAHLDDFAGHDGFTRDGLSRLVTAAGFAEPDWEVVHHLDKDGASYPLFLAVARRG